MKLKWILLVLLLDPNTLKCLFLLLLNNQTRKTTLKNLFKDSLLSCKRYLKSSDLRLLGKVLLFWGVDYNNFSEVCKKIAIQYNEP